MAYLGNAPARSFISFERQVFTIVNSQTAYTLDHSVNNENDLRLVINNIVQEPGSGKAYTASGTTLTLSAALTNGTDEMYCVFLGRATATNAPGAGSVNTAAITDLNVTTAKIAADAITEAKIADDAVESEHLNDNVISGQTELAAEPADTDEFLVSDAGTLKRIDYSYIKGGANLNHFGALAITSDTAISGAGVLSQGIVHNYNSSITVSSGKIKVAQTGWYLVLYGVSGKCTSGSDAFRPVITITENDGGATEDGNYAYLYLNGNNYDTGFVSYLWDVQDATNQAVYMGYAEASNITLFGDGGGKRDVTYMQIYRLGDT